MKIKIETFSQRGGNHENGMIPSGKNGLWTRTEIARKLEAEVKRLKKANKKLRHK